MENKFEYFSISTVAALPRFGKAKPFEVEQSKTTQSELQPQSDKISIYVNVPYCRTICQFCMLRRGAKMADEVPEDFVDNLISEATLYKDTLKNTKINAIYFGGGTPSMLNPKQFEKIVTAFDNLFSLTKEVEISFEGEAYSLNNYDLLSSLKSNSVKRVSFGLQTFDENLRKLLGRTDTIKDIYELKNKLDTIGFEEINIDYLYNLPDTDIKFLERDFERIKALNTTSVDCHPLKYISCSIYMLREIVERNMKIPTAKLRIEMFNFIREWAFSNDFSEQLVDQYTKMDCFRTNLYSRQLYGLDGGEYIGFGAGARSHYGDFGLLNTPSLHEYNEKILRREKPLTRVAYAPQTNNFITRFPKRNDIITVEDINRTETPQYFASKLDGLVNGGYVKNEQNQYKLTREGLNWYQNLQEELLAEEQKVKHLENIDERKTKFNEFGDYFQNVGGIL